MTSVKERKKRKKILSNCQRISPNALRGDGRASYFLVWKVVLFADSKVKAKLITRWLRLKHLTNGALGFLCAKDRFKNSYMYGKVKRQTKKRWTRKLLTAAWQ